MENVGDILDRTEPRAGCERTVVERDDLTIQGIKKSNIAYDQEARDRLMHNHSHMKNIIKR